MGKLSKTLVDYNENDQSWTKVKHVFHSHTQLSIVQKAYNWEDGLPVYLQPTLNHTNTHTFNIYYLTEHTFSLSLGCS